jgi:hypothetical protein
MPLIPSAFMGTTSIRCWPDLLRDELSAVDFAGSDLGLSGFELATPVTWISWCGLVLCREHGKATTRAGSNKRDK